MTDSEDRLRRALRAGSGYRQADDADWAAFQDRLARGAPRGNRRSPRWRVPLIAAAAVAVIAVATSAVVTHGFGIGGQQTASGGGSRWTKGVAVPIATASQVDGAAGGRAVVSANPDVSSPPVAPSTAGSASGQLSQASAGSVVMAFLGGSPPKAPLHGTITLPGGSTVDGGSHHSDGTPLGYLTLSAAFKNVQNGARYLWGAVGPTVLQVQISAVVPPTPNSLDSGFHVGPHWTIDSGNGTPWSLPEAADVVWTHLGAGWHGFAVQIPADARTVSAFALDSAGRLTQSRDFNPATGKSSDVAVPGQTNLASTAVDGSGAHQSRGGSEYSPPTTATTPAPMSASETATGTTGSAGHAAGKGCPLTGGSGSGSSDTGFNAGGIEFSADPPNPVVCFFDGVTTWNLTRTDKPMVAAITGVGTFIPMAEGAKHTKGRIVWGVVGPDVTSIHVAAGKSDARSVQISTVTAGVRVFHTRVPASGGVTVTITITPNDAAGMLVTTSQVADGPLPAESPTGAPLSLGVLKSAATHVAGTPIIVTYPDRQAGDGDQAALAGTISMTNGCVTVTTGTGTRVTPIFPASQVSPADPPTLFTFLGSSYSEGSELSVRGAYTDSKYPRLASVCPGQGFVITDS